MTRLTAIARDAHDRVSRAVVRLIAATLLHAVVVMAIVVRSEAAVPPEGVAARARTDRLLVRPKPDANPSDVAALHAGQGALLHKDYPQIDGWQVVIIPPGRDPDRVLAEYRRSPIIAEAEPDYLVHTTLAPNDPNYANGNLWNMNNTGQAGGLAGADINAPEAWDVLNSADEIVVAIVDSGLRLTHEDLAANLWTNPDEIPGNGIDDDKNGIVDDVHGIDAVGNTGNPDDTAGHGTHVAGIIGGVGNNGLGVVGVAWRVKLMACRFIGSSGSGSTSDAIQCIDYARQKGAKVINASWGSPQASSFLRSAIDKAGQAGIVFVAGAGNDSADNDSTEFYPASFKLDNIVAVAATTHTDTLADYSNYGVTSVDLAAPGSAIYSAWNSADNSYLWLSGTSMAAPHVSGAIALLRTHHPGDTYGQSISRLLAATDPLPALAGRCVTGGRLNLQKALGAAVVADFTANPLSGTAPLTVNFTDQSQGTIASRSWNFGDGSPLVTTTNPSHVFSDEGSFTVTLTVTGSAGATSTKSRVIAVVANYQVQAGNYAWIDPAGMTALPLANDGVSDGQVLPFNFIFYGQSYGQIFIGANGLLGFINQGLGTAANTDLPNVSVPNAVVMPYWDDLNPADGGSVQFGITGSAPTRKAVISWVGVPTRAKPTVSQTFQAVLLEQGNEILFQVQSVNSNKRTGGGKGATIGLENESGQVAAKYAYNGSTVLENNQAIRFVPASTGGMSVTPANGVSSSGSVGGPFTPSSQTFSVRNSGTAPINWTVAKGQPWLELSDSGGALSPGQTATVTASLNNAADSLPAGSYLDTLTFVNTANGIGNTSRSFALAVNGTTPVLAVTPAAGFTPSGVQGGPFAPGSQVYTLVNTGDATLQWQMGATQSWLSLSKSGGTLAPGDSTTVAVGLSADATSLAPGTYTDTVTFVNLTNGQGNGTRSVSLTVTSTPGALVVSPETGFDASGASGGPFTPVSMTFTLSNTGGSELDWSVATSATWLTLGDTGGSLAAGASTTVIATINDLAETLVPGTYPEPISFVNQSNGAGDTTRGVTLTVAGSAVTPRLQVVSFAGGVLTLKIIGGSNSKYVIEEALELGSWADLTTLETGADGTVSFTDSTVLQKARRYFRARAFQ